MITPTFEEFVEKRQKFKIKETKEQAESAYAVFLKFNEVVAALRSLPPLDLSAISAEELEELKNDGYGPRPGVIVKCLHCGDIYPSEQAIFELRFGNPNPFWWCKNTTCDGAGVGIDLKPEVNDVN